MASIREQKRSLTILGHRTSISLEDAFWDGLKEIARSDGLTLPALVARIDASRAGKGSLSSAIRVFVLERVRQKGA
ncbi:MAG TPA: ribbon-helix-helix domain-containing protein [Micropepsaceae bacterium]|nr:ribbon-helix-helix domain-containing protein [Micropepsaceae bacterium]HRK72525.1 ribbon-helix-helix domain-containing protein [Micropepsaceae bacterium]